MQFADVAVDAAVPQKTYTYSIPAGMDVQVDLVWEPPWTPDRMSPEAQGRFGWS